MSLSTLTEPERVAWESCHVEGLRASDLVDHTPWSASTIRTNLRRAREKMGVEQ